jgi:transcriptional regulator with XRE-family HTH domain
MRTQRGEHRALGLGDYVKARRGELDLSQEQLAAEAAVSTSTVRFIEKGGSRHFGARTERMLEAALGWTAGSIEAILAGGAPTVLGDGERPAREPGDVSRQLGYLTAILDRQPADEGDVRLSDAAWDALLGTAARSRRNVNDVLVDALRLYAEIVEEHPADR